MKPRLAVLAVAALLVSAAAAPASAQSTTDTTPTIAANGTGTATLTPDLADFTSACATRRRPRAARATRPTRRSPRSRRVLKAGGVADADIRTVGLSVARERVKRKHRKTITRYRAAAADSYACAT